EIFEEIGLSPNEAKIYETLLAAGEIGVAEISLKASVHRRNVYDAINRLVDKGLVFRIFDKAEHKFRAVTPDKLAEVLDFKQKKLSNAIPDLRKLYESKPLQEAAFIYKGKEGYKNYLRDMARVAEDTYFLGAKGLWFTPWVEKQYLQDYQTAMKRKNKKYYTLYDHRVKDKLPEAFKNVGGEYRILPKKYSAPGVTDVFGDHVVTFTSVDIGNVGEDVTIFVMVNPELAETYRTWFKMIWDFCPSEKK
ncbi:MAG TPA: helix-turn-helix domain-containing protein, partial [Candidatus Limnocylindria bacterium]|nr:helix-turn-helix domain-containing protein [Candidatus Limnocylindria bacterium]